MTFNPSVPNAGQSPGLFPPQNSTNFTRLKTIINADHVFNDTAQDTDGVHRQVTYISRDLATAPLTTGTNSILYSWNDSDGKAQLRFYNGTDDFQLTPPPFLYPIRVAATVIVAGLTTQTIYADPGFRWAGTGWGMVTDTVNYNFYNILRSGTNSVNVLKQNGNAARPQLAFSANDLTIFNPSIGAASLTWSLIINRIS